MSSIGQTRESRVTETHSVEKFIAANRLPHLLFYGPPGTGKTSTILAVARRIYGKNYRKQILEVPPRIPCSCCESGSRARS